MPDGIEIYENGHRVTMEKETENCDQELVSCTKDPEPTSSSSQVIIEYTKSSLKYGIRDKVPFLIMVISALQHILLALTGCLSTSSVVADAACIPYNNPARSQLFCTTIFMAGLCTLLQTAVGVRLPVFQGPSSSFLVPLLALTQDPEWKCPVPLTDIEDETSVSDQFNSTARNGTSEVHLYSEISWRIQEMSGALLLASLLEIIVGGTGMLRILLRYLGPIPVATSISLLGLSLGKLPIVYGKPQYWVAIGCTVMVVTFILYFKNIAIPLPTCKKGNNQEPRGSVYIFQLFPILIAICIMWFLSWILTITNVFPDDREADSYLARTDAKAYAITNTPWLHVTYPGQFGFPRMNVALTLGFFLSCFVSLIESVGDYYATQRTCEMTTLPDHAITRGIFVEGLGTFLSGTVGAGHATTSYSGNIALLKMSRTTSRSIMYCCSFMLIVMSFVGKVGAVITSIPNPIIGGVLMVIVGTLFAIGISNLKTINMTSSRNLLVLGVPFMTAVVIQKFVENYPEYINTGSYEADRVVKNMLGIPMFVGGVLSILLDNTAPRDEPKKYEMETDEDESFDAEREKIVYSWTVYPRIRSALPFLRYLPFMPK